MNTFKIGIFFFLVFTTLMANGQPVLQKVTFHAPENAMHWVAIRPDDASASPKHTKVEVWNKSRPDQWQPVCYVSGCCPKVSAIFEMEASHGCTSDIYVKGQSDDLKYNLPAQKLKANKEYEIAEFIEMFPKYKVQFLPRFAINWYYTTDPENGPWRLIRESQCMMFLLHKEPIDGESGWGEPTTFFHSSIYLSCLAANGLGKIGTSPDPDGVVSGIYSEFSDRCVQKVGGSACMRYWGGWNPLDPIVDPECRSIKGLLHYQDANCGEWAALLHDMVKIQGIDGSNVTVVIYGDRIGDTGIGALPTVLSDLLREDISSFFGLAASDVTIYPYGYFFVKSYTFGGVRKFYVEQNATTPPITVFGTTNKIYSANLTGAAAQGILDPRSLFENHAIVEYIKKDGAKIIYDPSYGTSPFANQNDWENASIEGFGAFLIYNNPLTGKEHYLIWLAAYNDSSIPQTSFIR